MFIALMCFVKTLFDYSSKNVFNKNKKSRDDVKAAKKAKVKTTSTKKQAKRKKKFIRFRKGMLDTTTPRTIEEYGGTVISRISDYNSNTYEKDDTSKDVRNTDDANFSYVSSILSQDIDFIQDTSDYQWFADYSYRGDANNICNNMHTSILSSLCTSYGYNDMARDLDANLAQVDMEDFRTEDIHSFLHSLPQICCTDAHEDSNGSLYKSEILFSPVKELPMVNFSIDSLDCEEHDIMLTCQANKDNYTIAFEGSVLMEKSTDSRQNETAPQTEECTLESVEKMSLGTTSSENSVSHVEKTFMNKSPLICSESPYTTWSKLKEDSVENVLKKQSSGNNNTTFTSSIVYADVNASCTFLKSQSLPNLNPVRRQFQLSRLINSTRQEAFFDSKTSQPNQFMKIYNLSRSRCGRKIHRSVFQHNANFDLITHFINQKHLTSYKSLDEQSSTGGLSCRFNKTLDNLNESSCEKDGQQASKKGCDVFEDSLLVADRVAEIDRSVAMSDSCSSFSSHSGRLEMLKKDAMKSSNSNGLPSDKLSGGNFIRDKYFDSARQFEKEQRRRKAAKKYVGGMKPIKIMDRSMQTSSSDGDSAMSPTSNQNTSATTNPVYVMYPNYTLPDLSFLQEHATELDLKNVFLWPQKFSPSPTTEHASAFPQLVENTQKEKKKRPCSCPDFESVRNKDYQHIRDWESLMFLLPREYCQALMKDPQWQKYAEKMNDFGRSLICTSAMEPADENKTDCTSNCSTGTQPSSGFRGSSTLLTDSGGSACKYEDQSKRPPLPKGILRNPVLQNIKSRKNLTNTKRYSMFELRRDDKKSTTEKRRSLPSQFSSAQQKKSTDKDYCSEDEGVSSAGSHCDSPGPHSDQDARRLEHLLEAAFHWNEDEAAQLRYQTVKKTVSFADRNNKTPPNSPNSSITGQHKAQYQMKLHSAFDSAIHEECESEKHSFCEHLPESSRTGSYNYKKELIDSVEEATKRIISSADCQETVNEVVLNQLCPALYAILNHGLKPTLETAFGDINNSVWQVVEAAAQLGPMTRALHELVLKLNNEDVLTEGLLKFNAFIFGLLNVRGLDTWFSYLRTRETILKKHYVEQGIMLSSSKGIMSDRQLTDQLLAILKPLAHLTFELDLLYECRMLHRSLMQLGQNSPCQGNNRTSWVLRKIVRSLASKEDELDSSMKSSGSRPRSCIDSSNNVNFNDMASTVKKRWSGIQIGSKLASAFERLGIEDEEVYSDSLDRTVLADKTIDESTLHDVTSSTTEGDASMAYDMEKESEELELCVRREMKFKQLQKKWEMLAEKRSPDSAKDTFTNRIMEDSNTPAVKSRIPRPVTSPVRPPSSLHFTIASSPRCSTPVKRSPSSPSSNIPMAVKKTISPTTVKRIPEFEPNNKVSSTKTKLASASRTSRIDQNVPSTHPVRPNSLPQHSQRYNKPKSTSERSKRPSSSSSRHHQTTMTKYVRTLGHRLPSDNGHLSYNEGEKLKVVLEVDDKWILCCRGDQKGLVPRSAVLPISGHL
ncbi:uncharacterized protein LOC135842599 isoform X2 [Planococcus citri]|uniref:uncharacterized protein LOC135842599 isoform X2 n=1 Tax=Planococcus citri TaxID=170843 RepID=UPI0031FA0386